MLNNEPRTLDESYSNACVTSDMTVPTHGEGASDRRVTSDYIIGAGMNNVRLGSALMRLHSEFHSAAKPQEPSAEQIEALARTLLIEVEKKDKKGKTYTVMVPDLRAAREQAWEWYGKELEMLMGKLKSLPEVRQKLTDVAASMGMERPAVIAPHVICFWLAQNCPACTGRGETVVPDTPKLSGRACSTCHGSQRLAPPHGPAGRRLAHYLDEQRSAWIGEMRRLSVRFSHHSKT